MLDIAGAASTSVLLSTNTVLTSMGLITTNSAAKASLNVMVACAYSLLFPRIHLDFPTRIESQLWLTTEMQKQFTQHHAQNQHLWAATPAGPGQTATLPSSLPIINPAFDTVLSTRGRPVPIPANLVTGMIGEDFPDLEISVPQFEPIPARALSVAENITIMA